MSRKWTLILLPHAVMLDTRRTKQSAPPPPGPWATELAAEAGDSVDSEVGLDPSWLLTATRP